MLSSQLGSNKLSYCKVRTTTFTRLSAVSTDIFTLLINWCLCFRRSDSVCSVFNYNDILGTTKQRNVPVMPHTEFLCCAYITGMICYTSWHGGDDRAEVKSFSWLTDAARILSSFPRSAEYDVVNIFRNVICSWNEWPYTDIDWLSHTSLLQTCASL